jgi:2-polyprenyl-3-methyl-5-hydroxy-6-metoxy-1,4-benzoquinol methylase
MMSKYGGPLKGGMPLYKFAGNRILTIFENASLGMRLSEFHSGYRAYSLRALRQIDFSRMTDDFHFDTEIIIKLQHQRFIFSEVPIPTYYGNEICYVNGMTYARNVTRAIWRYKQCIRSVARYPEFDEYFVHYPLKRSEDSSHTFAIALAGSGNAVLDVGCGKGFLAAELARNGNRVTGVDRLPPAEVLPCVEHYFQADLEGGIGKPGTFDRVLLLDVLEHMKDPGRLLTECKAALKDNGLIVVSLPNIANITVRLKLLFGKFDYQERGIMDKTHLHAAYGSEDPRSSWVSDRGRAHDQHAGGSRAGHFPHQLPGQGNSQRSAGVYGTNAGPDGVPDHAGGARRQLH